MEGRVKLSTIRMAALFLACISGLSAATLDVSVSARSMPWIWTAGGQNSAFSFGLQDGSNPEVVSVATGLAIQPGNAVTVTYQSGVVATCDVCDFVDAGGWTTSLANHLKGSSGTLYPSAYMSPYPIYLMALVGAFTDNSGTLVGQPFFLGDGPKTFSIPSGASQLQLGFNDDTFADDFGALNLELSTTPLASAPEPASFFYLLPLLALFTPLAGRAPGSRASGEEPVRGLRRKPVQ